MSSGITIGGRVRRPAAGTQKLLIKRIGPLLSILLDSIAVGFVGFQRFGPAPPIAPSAQTYTVRSGSLVSTVSSAGSVVATQLARLSFRADGTLVDLSVSVGPSVMAGQVLARQDTAPPQARLVSADSALKVTQMNLEQLKAGPTPDELQAARLACGLALVKNQDLTAAPRRSGTRSRRARRVGVT